MIDKIIVVIVSVVCFVLVACLLILMFAPRPNVETHTLLTADGDLIDIRCPVSTKGKFELFDSRCMLIKR